MKCYRIYANKNCQTIIENDNFNIGYAYVYILQRNKNNCTSITEVVIREHEDDPIVFNIGEDGYYLLCKLIVPIDITKPYYYFNGKFFKGTTEIQLQELIETNPEISQIEISYEHYFQICHLRQCYIDICQKIFNQQASIRCDITNNIDKELIYKRDLIWSAINVIKYLVEQEQFAEAERLLEKISGCNGLCYHDESKGCGCCCGKI